MGNNMIFHPPNYLVTILISFKGISNVFETSSGDIVSNNFLIISFLPFSIPLHFNHLH